MARIKNIELPSNKQIKIGLTAIYGVGRPLALQICEAAKVDPSKKVKDLTDDEVNKLRKELEAHTVEGDLRREVQMNIKNKMEVEGKVLEVLKGGEFIVELPNKHTVKAYVSGKMRVNSIRILPGDTVTVELSPYDLTRGRITFRHK